MDKPDVIEQKLASKRREIESTQPIPGIRFLVEIVTISLRKDWISGYDENEVNLQYYDVTLANKECTFQYNYKVERGKNPPRVGDTFEVKISFAPTT